MTDLLPYQYRVTVERDELAIKVNSLNDFLATDAFKALDYDERNRLARQHHAMSEYLDILEERIDEFPTKQESQ